MTETRVKWNYDRGAIPNIENYRLIILNHDDLEEEAKVVTDSRGNYQLIRADDREPIFFRTKAWRQWERSQK